MSEEKLPSVADCEIQAVHLDRGGCRVLFKGDVQGRGEVAVPDCVGVFDFDSVGEELSHLEWRETEASHARILDRCALPKARVLAFVSPWTNNPVLEIVTTATRVVWRRTPP